MTYNENFNYKYTRCSALTSCPNYIYKPRQNIHIRRNEKPKFTLDDWNGARIGELTDYTFNFSHKSDNGRSTQDNAIRSSLPKSRKKSETSTSRNLPFEIAPWIAALAAKNAGITKKHISVEKRYITTVNKTTQLLKNIDYLKDCFGYSLISSSLGFHYANSLVNGNQYMGTNVLGELISSLNTASSTEDSSVSINLINMMIEQFSISQSLFQMDNTNAALDEISSRETFRGLRNLTYESKITNDLIAEVNNFINQVYLTHPFSTVGVALYLKPLASKRYLSDRSSNFFPYKKKGSTNVSVAPEKYNPTSNAFASGTIHANLKKIIIDNNSQIAGVNDAKSFVQSVFATFNKENSKEINKLRLISKLSEKDFEINGIFPVSLDKYFKFDSNAKQLLNDLSNSPEDISQLFISMDKYLTQTLLQNRKPELLPLDALSRAISNYDQHKKDIHFDSNQAKKQLLDSLTDSADTIIQYYNQWKAYVNNRFQDPSDDISNLVDQLRPVVNLLQHVHDNTDSWNNQISNH